MKRGFVFLMVLAVADILLAGCAIPGASSSIPGPTAQPPSPGPSTGTIKVLVTDAPGYSVTSVKIWFSEVWLHKADGQGGAGGWIPLEIIDDTDVTFDTDRMIDLAELDGADDAVLLAETQIEEGMEGWYNQILVIMNEDLGVKVDYTDPDENTHTDVAAKLPSGNLRFVRPFEVVADGDTEILLDFDLEKSVVFTGVTVDNEDNENTELTDVKVIVKPVVKLQITSLNGQANVGELYLYEKEEDGWSIVEGGAWGLLEYNLSGETFDFEFKGHGLEQGYEYTLIYYPDPWPGDGLICLGSGTADGGKVHIEGLKDTGDLPAVNDDNYPEGAKIWLVLTGDVDCEGNEMTGWNPEEYLFENNLITFDDTDV